MSDYYFPNNLTIRDFEDYVNKYYDELRRAYWRTRSQMNFIDFCYEQWSQYLRNNDELEYGI